MPILMSAVVLSFYGFYQKIFIGGNISSFMNNPNVFAGYMVGIICLTFGFVIENLSRRIIYILLLIIFILALLLTGSIAGLLSVIFGIFIFFYLKKVSIPKKYLFLSIII